MTSANLRRRLRHGDVDGGNDEHLDSLASRDGLTQPLLSSADGEDDERRKEQIHWSFLFSKLIALWAQWLANFVIGSGSIIGRLLPYPQNGQSRIIPPTLSSLQEERLKVLQRRLAVPFDGSRIEHQLETLNHSTDMGILRSKTQSLDKAFARLRRLVDALKQLWKLAFPLREIPALKSELWKEMGWQGTDPSTDFRGGGYISLENLIFFARKYPEAFQRLLHKQDGNRAEWEYPFAVAGINVSFMLTQMLDIQSGVPYSLSGIRFLELLGGDEMAFDNLYCVAFQMMDAQWLAKRASYMQFNEVLNSTRTQLERELSLEDVFSVRDLPAYNLLRR